MRAKYADVLALLLGFSLAAGDVRSAEGLLVNLQSEVALQAAISDPSPQTGAWS